MLKEYNKIYLSTASAKREEQKEEKEERVEGKNVHTLWGFIYMLTRLNHGMARNTVSASISVLSDEINMGINRLSKAHCAL